MINVYAYDIAKIENWKQRIWAGQNVAPDGAVASELLASQQRSRPAGTIAPEVNIASAIEKLNQITQSWRGFLVFAEHDATPEILRNVHRFRSIDRAGLLSLAKDIARLTADRIDASAIQKLVPPPKGERWGGIKSLEKLVATVIPAADARAMLSPIVGAYELRLGDAHLPSSKIKDAMALVGVDENCPMIEQGKRLIESVAISLDKICDTIQTVSIK